MVFPKRKAQYNIDGRDVKRSSYAGRHQNIRGGGTIAQQPHTREQTSEQLFQLPQNLAAQTMHHMFGSLQQHRLPQVAQQQQQQVEEPEADKQKHNPGPFAPYSELKIPILCSTNIDHGFSPALQTENLDSTALKHYYRALAIMKAGMGREQLGLPPSKPGHGSPVTIDHVDLYLDLNNGKVYVAASERGLMTVPDYLKLSDIAVERKLRFTGKTPDWAKAVFDAAEKRYVTELWDALHGTPLPVRSLVQVLDTFPLPVEPAGMWGNMYSAHLKKVVQFPLAYTTTDREFAMSRDCPGPLSAHELRHVLALPEKGPSPQELGEALFAQAQECDRDTLDLQMTKSRDDYLKGCGYLYGKYAPANTQERKGIFFESPPFSECEDNGNFIVLVKGQGTKESFMVEWTQEWNASLQDDPKRHNLAAPKAGGGRTARALFYTPYSRSASAEQTDQTADHPNVSKGDEIDRALKLEELRQKLIAKKGERMAKKSSASPSRQASTASGESLGNAQATREVGTDAVSIGSPSTSSRKRKRSVSPVLPTKRDDTSHPR